MHEERHTIVRHNIDTSYEQHFQVACGGLYHESPTCRKHKKIQLTIGIFHGIPQEKWHNYFIPCRRKYIQYSCQHKFIKLICTVCSTQ